MSFYCSALSAAVVVAALIPGAVAQVTVFADTRDALVQIAFLDSDSINRGLFEPPDIDPPGEELNGIARAEFDDPSLTASAIADVRSDVRFTSQRLDFSADVVLTTSLESREFDFNLVNAQWTHSIGFTLASPAVFTFDFRWSGPINPDILPGAFANATFGRFREAGDDLTVSFDFLEPGFFTATIPAGRYGFSLGSRVSYASEGPDSFFQSEVLSYRFSVTTIPTTAAATPLALAGLLAARRRR